MAPSSRWSLKGQSFIVTGGSKGIGKAVVKSLVEHEASTVIFCSRSEIHLSNYLVSLGVGDSSVVKHVMCDVSTDEGRKELVEKAQGFYQRLQRKWNVTYDQSGAIGRRYRRADEAGVPFALTVDFDTLEGDGSITLRDRDSTEQQRMSMDEAVAYLGERINP